MRDFVNLETEGTISAGDIRLTLPVEFVWDSSDPLALTMIIYRSQDELDLVPWTFAAALLRDGLYDGAVGEGDVKISSLSTKICYITVGANYPSGSATFEFSWKLLSNFIDQIPTYQNVEITDEELDRLLGG